MNESLENTGHKPATGNTRLPLIGMAVIIVAIAVFAYLFLQQQRHQSAQQTNTGKVSTTLSTPIAFSDFAGAVTSINGREMVVKFSGYDANGKLQVKDYRVQVDDSTTLLSIDSTTASRSTKPATLQDFTTGATVLVTGNGNVAALDSFTATKLIRYQQ